MRWCVSNHTLWLVAEGEARAADRAHILACASCSARYRQLERDLRVLCLTLSGPPPAERTWNTVPRMRRRWMAAAVVAAVLSVVVWSSGWLLRPMPPSSLSIGERAAVWSFLEEVSLALFATADAEALGEVTEPGLEPEVGVPYAGFLDTWPCDDGTWWLNVNCETQPFLLAEGR